MIDDLADAPAHQPFALRERHDVVVNKQAALLAAASLLPTPPRLPPVDRIFARSAAILRATIDFNDMGEGGRGRRKGGEETDRNSSRIRSVLRKERDETHVSAFSRNRIEFCLKSRRTNCLRFPPADASPRQVRSSHYVCVMEFF